MPYSRYPPFLFIAVPRTGSESITAALPSLEEPNRGVVRFPKDPLTVSIPHRLSKHATIAEARWRGIIAPSFGFVRNPYSRALSWFAAGFSYGVPLPDAGMRQQFADFLNRVRFRYMAPCWDFLSIDGQVAVDRIGRFESIGEDFANICQWLGVDALPLNHENNSHVPVHYSEYYSENTRNLVLERYAVDFDRFDYETE